MRRVFSGVVEQFWLDTILWCHKWVVSVWVGVELWVAPPNITLLLVTITIALSHIHKWNTICNSADNKSSAWGAQRTIHKFYTLTNISDNQTSDTHMIYPSAMLGNSDSNNLRLTSTLRPATHMWSHNCRQTSVPTLSFLRSQSRQQNCHIANVLICHKQHKTRQ